MKSKKKRRQRKYVRFEREHWMSLWQGDWKQLDDGGWLLAFMDDASHRIMGMAYLIKQPRKMPFPC